MTADTADDHTVAQLAASTRLAMRRMAQTVSVISATYQGARMAMAATAVNSLSLDPPAMLVAVNRSASIFAAMRAGADFCINVLAADQAEIAESCGGRLKGEDRFTVGTWTDFDGVPALEGAQARLLCRQDGFVGYGTHGIFIGRVLRAEVGAQTDTLLYADGAYRALTS